MKRFLIISLVVVLVVVMMAVPAMAASYEAIEGEGCLVLTECPAVGKYYVAFECCKDAPNASVEALIVENFYFDPGELVEAEMVDFAAKFTSGERSFSGFLSFSLQSGELYVYMFDNFGCTYSLYNLVMVSVDELEGGNSSGSVAQTTDSIFAVFAGIGTWLVAELGNVTSLFYHADTGLTLLGVLAVCGLGFAVVFFLISWIRNLLQFRS